MKDSKALSPRKREDLSKQIKELIIKQACVELSPSNIDKVVLKGKKLHKLNFLEAQAMAEVINELKPDVAYVDASDVKAERYGEQIKKMLSFDTEVVSEHKADQKYLVVSAASILAKVRRDHRIKQIQQRFGDIGTGYPHDPKTREFIKTYLKNHIDLPKFVRKSWKTIKRLKEELENSSIDNYFTYT